MNHDTFIMKTHTAAMHRWESGVRAAEAADALGNIALAEEEDLDIERKPFPPLSECQSHASLVWDGTDEMLACAMWDFTYRNDDEVTHAVAMDFIAYNLVQRSYEETTKVPKRRPHPRKPAGQSYWRYGHYTYLNALLHDYGHQHQMYDWDVMDAAEALGNTRLAASEDEYDELF